MQTNQISNAAAIREMDTEELLAHLHNLGLHEDITGAWAPQVRLIKQQYRQITGTDLTTDLPGMTIAQAAMLHAEERLVNHQNVEA